MYFLNKLGGYQSCKVLGGGIKPSDPSRGRVVKVSRASDRSTRSQFMTVETIGSNLGEVLRTTAINQTNIYYKPHIMVLQPRHPL